MTCNLKHCDNCIETTDGFCKIHGYYSATNNEYISKHIKKYIKNVNNADFKQDKVKNVINLWYYLSFKKEFLLKNDKLLKTIMIKADEFRNGLVNSNLEKFNSLHQKIEKFLLEDQ